MSWAQQSNRVWPSKGVFTWYRYEFHSGTKSNFVPRLHGSHFTGITRSFLWALVLTSHFGALLTIDTHSLPVPVNSATHLLPERNLVPPLHDTGTECGQISYRYENRSELVPVWLVPVWHFVPVDHVNEYRATSGNRDELVPEWNSYRYHVNTP